MKITPDFITEGDEDELRCQIEIALGRLPERKGRLRNRVLRFGWDYLKPKKWIGPTPPPEWVWRPVVIACSIWPASEIPDSFTINEYTRGQRIAPHIDSPAFGDVVILSLLADATMRFTSPAGETRDFLLPRRSLTVMSGELRHRWTHETVPLEADLRISIVYRKRLT